KRGDTGDAIAAVCCDGLDIGGDSGAGRGVESGNGKNHRPRLQIGGAHHAGPSWGNDPRPRQEFAWGIIGRRPFTDHAFTVFPTRAVTWRQALASSSAFLQDWDAAGSRFFACRSSLESTRLRRPLRHEAVALTMWPWLPGEVMLESRRLPRSAGLQA